MTRYCFLNLVACCLLFIYSHYLPGQSIVKLDVLAPIFSTAKGSIELFWPYKNQSVQLSASFTKRTTTIWEGIRPNLKGFGFEVQGRHYLSPDNQLPVGIYFGAFGSYSQQNLVLSIPAGKVDFLNGNSKFLGALAGYQKGFKQRAFIDITMGFGYHFADYSGRFSDRGRVIPSIISSGFLPKLDLKVGFGF